MSEYIIGMIAEVIERAKNGATIRITPKLQEIVRCRDCASCELQTVSYSDKPLSVCIAEWCKGAEGDNPLVEPNGFCSWAERRQS